MNGIFEDAGAPRVTSVQLLNPYIDKDALTDKMSVLDIVARTDQAILIDIEIQIRNTGEMRERSLYYWAKLYEGQLHESDTYHTLRPTIAINVLDFVEIPNDRVHNVFQLRNQDGALFTDHLTLHFLEVPKFAQAMLHEQTALIRWLAFLNVIAAHSPSQAKPGGGQVAGGREGRPIFSSVGASFSQITLRI